MASAKKNRKKVLLISLLIVIIAISAVYLLKSHKDTVKSSASSTPKTSTIKNTPTNPKTPQSSTTSTPSKSTAPSNSQNTTSSSTATPIAPFGNFVSNYNPDLSGSPSPNLMQSTCNTTPGATCVISFSMNGVTKSLAPETANTSGSANWTWHLQDIGLTVGYWNISATATLNGKSVTTGDTLQLNVQQ